MADGDLGNVNAKLLDKLKNTSAEAWKEERRRALLAKRAGGAASTASSSSFAYLPNDYDENAKDEDAPAAKPANASYDVSNGKSNLEFLKSMVAARPAPATAHAAAAPTPAPTVAAAPTTTQQAGALPQQQPNILIPMEAMKRPREDAPSATPAVAPPVPEGGLKAMLLAKLKAKRDAEMAAAAQ